MNSQHEQERIRIGQINYTNVWPVSHFFPAEKLANRIELITQVPSELNRAMAEGRIDLGPVSSFEYGLNHEQYLLFPDLSVSAFGKVNSILLFYKKPLEQALNGKIALTTASATSVNLLKIIVEKFYHAKPEYFYETPSLDDMMKHRDAALLIGDDAIRSSWRQTDYGVLDLGEKWNELTGQWMTFAVWALRKDTAEKYPEDIARIYHGFQEGKALGYRNLPAIAEAARERIGGTLDYWSYYFRHLNHDFASAQQNGLQLYYRHAAEMGLLARDVPLQIWSEQSVHR